MSLRKVNHVGPLSQLSVALPTIRSQRHRGYIGRHAVEDLHNVDVLSSSDEDSDEGHEEVELYLHR